MRPLDVKIVTCHDVNNFGASLQVYALQTYLEQTGHHVQVVDYKPYYQQVVNHHPLQFKSGKGWLRGVASMLYNLPSALSHEQRNRLFKQFTENHLHLTDRFYDIQQLIAANLKADVFIAGSDQIWNSMYLTGRDSVFYLDFVSSNARKVAYAPSLLVDKNDKRLEYLYRQKLAKFDYLSVREKCSLPFVQQMGREDCEVVCDPVLLLSSTQWDTLFPIQSFVKEPYLLVYDFDNSKQITEISREIARRESLKIINVSIDTLKNLGKRMKNIGPIEFLSLIRGASFVVSSSYHATLLSLLFHKRFCVVRRQLDINFRMEDLLGNYGLHDRFVSNYTPALLKDDDYSHIDKKMQSLVSLSKDYLSRALDIQLS